MRVGRTEGATLKHVHCHMRNWIAGGNLLRDTGSSNPVLCDNLEGWDGVGGGREFQEGGDIRYPWLIRVVWQKPTQYCKATILQVKNK